MADDKLLPAKLDSLHPRFKTPYVSILICAVVVSLMIVWSLEDLFIIDVMVYGAGLFIEFITLIMLRKKEPNAHRPFKIPLNTFGLSIMLIIPFIIYGIAISGALSNEEKTTTAKPVLFAVAALCSAEVAWQVIRLHKKYKATAK